jgi:hypothetical protein
VRSGRGHPPLEATTCWIRRETPRWTALDRRLAAVEREFGRLNNHSGRCHRFASVDWTGFGCTST